MAGISSGNNSCNNFALSTLLRLLKGFIFVIFSIKNYEGLMQICYGCKSNPASFFWAIVL